MSRCADVGGFHRGSHAVWTQSQPRGGYLGNHGSPPLQAQNGHARHVWHHAAVLARGENLEKQSFCGFVFIPNILNEVLWGIVPKRFLSAPLLHFIFQICFLSSFYCPVLTCILSWFRQIVLTGFLFTNNRFICFIENILPQYRNRKLFFFWPLWANGNPMSTYQHQLIWWTC